LAHLEARHFHAARMIVDAARRCGDKTPEEAEELTAEHKNGDINA
jgi:chromosome condensin MukBEF complex kleisin-like MukF subunit